MGQDKKQLTKLLAFVKDLYDNPDNKEFAAGIQAIVLQDLQTGYNRGRWTKQIDEIYELCLKKNLREQAEDLYKAFPLLEIADDLASLYVEMEDARRHNDFDSFGFNLYRQIELIVNTIIKGTAITEIYNGIKKLKPLTRRLPSKETIRTEYKSEKSQAATVEDLILWKRTNSADKPLSDLTALEKARAIFYMLNKGCEIDYYRTKDDIITPYTTLYSIYRVRNHYAHSGGAITDYQKSEYEKLVAEKTQNYLHFLSFLLTFIKGISENYPIPKKLYDLAGISFSK